MKRPGSGVRGPGSGPTTIQRHQDADNPGDDRP
jgi:hypothetical protein